MKSNLELLAHTTQHHTISNSIPHREVSRLKWVYKVNKKRDIDAFQSDKLIKKQPRRSNCKNNVTFVHMSSLV